MPNESIDVNYSQVNNWGSGFQGEISITNNGSSNLDSWDLEFDMPNEITGIWDAQVVSNDNGNYTIKHESWNREIKAGETITVNFVSYGNGSTPQNFDIDGSEFASPSSSDSIYSFSNPNLDSNLSLGQTYQGRATFYDAANPTGGKGNSGYDIPYGNLEGVTAINNIQWNGSEASGAFLEVSGPKQREGAQPIIVQVSDLLYERSDGLDLSGEAFAQVADPVDGVVNIEYELISPGDDFRTPYGYTIGQGIVAEGIPESNPYYGAVRLNNHRYPIESVELITDDGNAIALQRGSDNRFTFENGALYGAQDLRVTDIFGQQVTLNDIDITNGSDADIVTGQQFALV
jgi:expansin